MRTPSAPSGAMLPSFSVPQTLAVVTAAADDLLTTLRTQYPASFDAAALDDICQRFAAETAAPASTTAPLVDAIRLAVGTEPLDTVCADALSLLALLHIGQARLGSDAMAIM